MNLDEYINNAIFSVRSKSETTLHNEYELDKWKSFENFIGDGHQISSLLDYLTAVKKWILGSYPSEDPQPVCVDGEVKMINKYNLVSRNYDIIIDALNIIKKNYNLQHIVELGSGLGNNLAIIYQHYPDIHLQSWEYSETARRLQRQHLLPRIKNLHIKKFNLYSEKNEFKFENSVCITSFVFSLIKYFPVTILDELTKSGAKYVINIEPLFEIQDMSVKLDAKIRDYITANDYNQDYFNKLLEYESLGKIKILQCKKNIYGINAFFPGSLLIWEICDAN